MPKLSTHTQILLTIPILLAACFTDPENTVTSASVTDGDGDGDGEPMPDLPEQPLEPYDECEISAECPVEASQCRVDDFGRSYCTRACETAEDCPVPTSGTALYKCSSVFGVCALSCSNGLHCPDGMFCTNTYYEDTYSGGLCLWELEPIACSSAGQICAVNGHCCEGLTCNDGTCG